MTSESRFVKLISITSPGHRRPRMFHHTRRRLTESLIFHTLSSTLRFVNLCEQRNIIHQFSQAFNWHAVGENCKNCVAPMKLYPLFTMTRYIFFRVSCVSWWMVEWACWGVCIDGESREEGKGRLPLLDLEKASSHCTPMHWCGSFYPPHCAFLVHSCANPTAVSLDNWSSPPKKVVSPIRFFSQCRLQLSVQDGLSYVAFTMQFKGCPINHSESPHGNETRPPPPTNTIPNPGWWNHHLRIALWICWPQSAPAWSGFSPWP